jgi:lysyl-tRNA synthetase, class I
MQWLNAIIEELERRRPEGLITVSSGVSPSGTYHLGTLREVLTAEVIARELRRRGREVKHLHIVDDLDVFRKVPVNIDESFSQYLGRPLCDVPAPDGSDQSYADYFLADLIDAIAVMGLDVEVIRANERYRQGFYVPAIEKTVENIDQIKSILEEISGRKLDPSWTPIQIIEDGRVKNRQFTEIDTESRTISYTNKDDEKVAAHYDTGEVALSWRVDWPARWWLLSVDAEPFGRDHATKGGSYDTGKVIAKDVFDIEPPVPVPYNFINRVGDTKKMSKSAGDVVTAKQLLSILPPEIVWFFLLRSSPDKLLFFGEGETLLRLFDDFAELLAKPDRELWEQQLVELCLHGIDEPTVSNIPFSHLVSSYQAALRNSDTTIEVIARTEHVDVAHKQKAIIEKELRFIDSWLDSWAPDDLKFSLRQDDIDVSEFTEAEREYFAKLGEKIIAAPIDADGAWFHEAIYSLKDEVSITPKELFSSLYRLIIGKASGPRAGWFLSILPRDELINRLTQAK